VELEDCVAIFEYSLGDEGEEGQDVTATVFNRSNNYVVPNYGFDCP